MSDAATVPDDDPRLDAPIPRDEFGGRAVPEVVALLTRLLSLASAGKIRAVAAVAVARNRNVGTAFAGEVGPGQSADLVAGGERLKLRILRHGKNDGE